MPSLWPAEAIFCPRGASRVLTGVKPAPRDAPAQVTKSLAPGLTLELTMAGLDPAIRADLNKCQHRATPFFLLEEVNDKRPYFLVFWPFAVPASGRIGHVLRNRRDQIQVW